MRQRTRLIVNAVLNSLGMLVTFATRFIIIPYAIAVLGRSLYGLWAIVGQMLAYTRLLEMGLRGALSREVALGMAQNRTEEVGKHVNTAAGYYTLVGAVLAVLGGVLAVVFPDWFDAPQDARGAARVMVLFAVLALALTMPNYAYGAVVAGVQRYDIISGTQILGDLLRLALVLLLLPRVSGSTGLIVLAVASGGTLLLAALVRTVAALRLCPQIRLTPWKMERGLLWPLMGFGINTVIYMMSLTAGLQLAQILIGAWMSPAQAADFSVATMFVLAGHSFIVAFSVSTRVVASRYQGLGDRHMLRKLMLRSSRYSGLIAVAAMLVLCIFAGPLFSLWVGRHYEEVDDADALVHITRACRVLALGFGVFWLMLPAYNVLNGMGRHRFPALLAALAAGLSMIGAAWAVSRPDMTIDRLSVVLVAPIFPAWGLVMLGYTCRATGQSVGRFLWEVGVVPALGCLPSAALALAWSARAPAESWGALVAQLLACAVVMAPTAWLFVLARDDRAQLLLSAKTLLRRRPPPSEPRP